MSDGYIPVNGRLISPAELRIPKAREVARALEPGRMRWVKMVECRRLELPDGDVVEPSSDCDETIVFDVEVELPQRRACDIRRRERLSVTFWADDRAYPEVLALREDFPQVLHLNFRSFEIPRSLCLFEEPYSELKLRWTAPWFIEWTRSWLAGTAAGTLHAADQALEPLLFGSRTSLVLPSDLFSVGAERPERLTVYAVNSGNDRVALLAERPVLGAAEQNPLRLVATVLHGEPQQHGAIRSQPRNLSELHEFLESADLDLLGTLRGRLLEWREDPSLLRSPLIIIALLPKKRDGSGPVEATDAWAFLCMRPESERAGRREAQLSGRDLHQLLSIGEIGERVGLWQLHGGVPGMLVGGGERGRGQDVPLHLLNPSLYLTREAASRLNGIPTRDSRRITAIGAGALGSQVFLNLVRAAYGEWKVIDKDFLLAHNLARQALFGMMVGSPKAEQAAQLANSVIDGEPIAEPIVADVLEPSEAEGRLHTAFEGADVIADFSASVAVARHLARDVKSDARRVSLFLNPRGSDLVLLAEDAARNIPLDVLEMQYYRLLTEEGHALGQHLRPPDGLVRYAHSCRDLSATIPQDHVALHAATGSRALRRALSGDDAVITVWQADEEGNIRSVKAEPSPMFVEEKGDWTIYTDARLLDKVRRARAARLPKETGGALIGSFDMQRKIVYVVDTLPSPPDSKEQRTSYIRGHVGLNEGVERVKGITAGNLRYVGEWHSHPPEYDAKPSGDDRDLFGWLSDLMAEDGLPPLMLIAGESDQFAWFIEDMS
jgi:integrative and conjugative element protein (TIGR02256 family)